MEEESEEEEEEQDDMDVQGIKKEKNVKQVCLIFFAESLFFIRFLKNYQRFCKNLNILMKNISSTKNRKCIRMVKIDICLIFNKHLFSRKAMKIQTPTQNQIQMTRTLTRTPLHVGASLCDRERCTRRRQVTSRRR